MIRKATDALQEGDIVSNHGMRILIDGPAVVRNPDHDYPVYAWPGLVLNADELCDKGSAHYDLYIAMHLRGVWWRDRGAVPEQRDRWTVQGNRMCSWHIEGPWRELGSLYEGADNYGGDIQIGNALSRRFVHATLPGRLFEVIAYPIRGDGSSPMPPEDAPIRLAYQTHMTVCRDAEEPGSTTVWSDIEYSDLPERYDIDCADIESAETLAKILIRSFDPDRFINWDGAPGMEF